MPNQSDPKVIQLLKEYRQALIHHEDEQAKRLAKKWLELEKSLEDDMRLLAFDIQEAQATGSIVTEQLLYRMDRYKKLQAQMKDEILSFAKTTAANDIEKEQRAFGQLALSATDDALKLTAAIGFTFDKLPADAVETYVGLLGDGTPLYRLLKEAYPDALDGVIKAFLEGAARGLNPNQIAYNASQAMGLGLDRLLLIARTEQLRVNRLVSAEQYRASGLDGYMRRVAVKDANTCMACLMLDGQIIPLDEELDDHPRGRCVAVFQIAGAPLINWTLGADWFAQQDQQTQIDMMGQTKWDMWQAGQFNLSDIAKIDYNDTWGNSPRVATIAELSNE